MDHEWTKKWTLPQNGRSLTNDELSNPNHPFPRCGPGSIPIARFINPDDSVDFTRLSSLNSTKNGSFWTVVGRC